MYRFFFRFVVTTLTILTANLLTTAVSDYMTTYKNHVKPLTFTIIAMAIIVVIFYPLFMKMEELLKKISAKMVKSGNSLAGKYFGLAISFLTGLSVLCYFYAKMWYHIDLLNILFSGNIGRML
jgi:uncharacterized membrane protein required for colicin V production